MHIIICFLNLRIISRERRRFSKSFLKKISLLKSWYLSREKNWLFFTKSIFQWDFWDLFESNNFETLKIRFKNFRNYKLRVWENCSVPLDCCPLNCSVPLNLLKTATCLFKFKFTHYLIICRFRSQGTKLSELRNKTNLLREDC